MKRPTCSATTPRLARPQEEGRGVPWIPWARRVGLAVVGCLCALGVVEGAVRLFDPQPPLPYWPHPVYGWTHMVGRHYSVFVAETGKRVAMQINAQGLRDREYPYAKPQGAFRILVLGDSFTEGTFVELADTYAKQLERLLGRSHRRVEVLNAGVGGYGTDQELLFLMREGIRYRPDLVIVGFFTGNDLHDNSTKRLCTLVNGELVIQSDGAVGWSKRALTVLKAWLQQHLQTYLFVKKKTERLYPVRKLLGALGLVQVDDAEELRYDRDHWGQPLPNELRILLREEPPDVVQGWSLTTAILTKARTVAEAVGARLLVVAIPSVYQVDTARYQEALREFGLDATVVDRNQPQQVLRQWGERQGVPVLDLLPAFRDHVARGASLYFREGHWNERGHYEAALAIAGVLQRDRVAMGARE